MTTINTIRYFQVDDEVLWVSWIPSALRTCYYQKHRDCFRKAEPLEHQEGTHLWSFNLVDPDNTEIKVEYTIFETGEELLNLNDSDLKGSIIILDLMAQNNQQDPQSPVGNETLDELLNRGIDKSRIYMLTAFEQTAREIIKDKLAEDHILTKPIDAITLAPILLKAGEVPL